MQLLNRIRNWPHRKVRISKLQLDLYAVGYITIGVVVGVLLVAGGVFKNLSALIVTDKTITSAMSYNQGTLTDTAVRNSGDSAYIELAGGDGSAWLNPAFQYRSKLTFNNSAHAENLVNFPVLVKLTSTNFDFSHAKSDGSDIRFTDSNGTTILNFEKEKWDNVGQEAILWVNVPQIDASSSTDNIYIYYGNVGASDGQQVVATWDTNYMLIQHLEETPSNGVAGFNDSTSLGEIGTPHGFNDTSGSKVGYATPLGNGVKLDGVDDDVTYPGYGNLSTLGSTDYTIEAWVKWDGTSDADAILQKGQSFWGDGNDPLYLGLDSSNGALYFAMGDNGGAIYAFNTTTGKLTADTWALVTVQKNDSDSTLKLFVNGTQVASVANTFSNLTTTEAFRIGTNMGGNTRSNIAIDEVRISDISRSPDWINASYMSTADTLINYSAELRNLAPTGSWESAGDTNAIDLVWNGGWGNGSGSSTAFSANVENVGVGGSIVFQMRVASTTLGLSGATYQTLGTASSGTIFSVTKDDLDSLGLATASNRYVQVKTTLNSADGSTNPRLLDFNLTYMADNSAPDTNAADIIMNRTLGGDSIASGGWTNNPAPAFSWQIASDTQSGIAGYCLYLGTDVGGDPVLSKGLLGTSAIAMQTNPCQFSLAANSIDFATLSLRGSTWLSTSSSNYYLNIKAIDNNGNVFGSSVQFIFKYDTVAPNNPTYFSLPSDFVSSKNVSLIWPSVGSDGPSDSNSGVSGLQYRIGSAGTWYGDLHTGTQDFADKLTNDGAYTMDPTYDYPVLSDGVNQVFMRTYDAAGNVSVTNISGVLKLNTVAPSTPQNLEVAPADNTTNSYSFDWDTPLTFTGQVNNITYCYSVNVLPSSISCNYTSAGISELAADAYANQPGTNTMYVVARDEALNINYATYASVDFTYSGSAPGIPQNLAISDISIKETANWRLSISWTEPSQVGAGINTYKIFRSTGTASCTENFAGFTQAGSVGNSSPFFADSGLIQTNYKYCVKACDSANNCSAVSSTVTGFPNGKFTEPAELTSGPNIDLVTSRSAKISWTTARNSDSKIAFGLSSNTYFEEEPSVSAQKPDHTISLNSLDPGTRYFYRAKWTDEDGNTGMSSEKEFITSPPPVVKDVAIVKAGLDNALIRFNISGASKAKILYGKSTSFGGVQEIATSITETVYTVLLSDLDDGTKYFYKIVPVDADNFEYAGTVLDFSTFARPRLSNITVEEVKNVSQPTVKVDWISNTEVSSIITYFPADQPDQEQDAIDLELKAGEHTLQVKALRAETKYGMKVRGIDRLGNEAVSDIQYFTTSTDTRPPTISNLRIDSIISNSNEAADQQRAQLIISWDTDEFATSQVEFGQGTSGVYSQSSQIETNLKTNHLIVISNLTPSQVYNVRAISKDSAGNESKSIDTVAITPKVTSSVLDLVTGNLLEIFRFLR